MSTAMSAKCHKWTWSNGDELPSLEIREGGVCAATSSDLSLEHSAIGDQPPPRLELVPSAGKLRPDLRTPLHGDRGPARMTILDDVLKCADSRAGTLLITA